MTDNTFQLLDPGVSGWAPGTRLYQRGDEYWLVSIPDCAAIIQSITNRAGMMVPTETAATPPHAEIYRATVQRTPMFGPWIPDSDNPPGEPPAHAVAEFPDDEHGSLVVDGVRWGGVHRVVTGETFTVAAVDENDDPLDGLTPWDFLPPGTTFEQALNHITLRRTECPRSP